MYAISGSLTLGKVRSVSGISYFIIDSNVAGRFETYFSKELLPTAWLFVEETAESAQQSLNNQYILSAINPS